MIPDFRCEFNSGDGDGRRLESLEAQHRSDPLFHAAVILLDSIIEVFARADPDTPRHLSFCF